MMMYRLLLTGLCAALALPVASGSALAQAFLPGDALVLDLTGNRIIGVKLEDGGGWSEGDQFVVPSGGPVTFPRGLAIASQSNGALFISGNSQVVRVQAEEDRQDFLTQFFSLARGITFDESEENLFVAAPPSGSYTPVIARVDRATGLAQPVSLWFIYPRGVALDPRDTTKLLVAESQGVFPFVGIGVYQLDPDNAEDPPTDISTNLDPDGVFSFPQRLAADDDRYIYVTDPGFGSADPQVVRVDRDIADPQANQKVVALGGYLVYPVGIAIEDSGTLLVSDADAQAVIRVFPDDYEPGNPDPTHNQQIVSSGDLFDTPWEIQIVPDLSAPSHENLLVTDAGNTAAETGVFKVIPSAESRQEVATGVDFSRPTGAVVDRATGDLVVVDAGNQTVYRVNPDATDDKTLVAAGGHLVAPSNVVVDANGDYLVTDPVAKAVIRIFPDDYEPGNPDPTHNQEVVSPNGSSDSFFKRPMATEIAEDGRLLVADAGDPDVADDGRLIEVNPAFGQQGCLFQGGLLEEVTDVVRDKDSSFVFAGRGPTPVLRLASPGFKAESESSEYQSPAGVAIDANRDILVVDAGDPETLGDGRILRLDPLESEPTVVAGGDGLSDPFGIAPDALPNPPPAFLDGDQDLDGVSDEDDNCVDIRNPEQRNANPWVSGDPDTDVFGDVCDADFDNDGIVGLADFILLSNTWGSSEGDPDFERVDIYPYGVIGISEFLVLSNFWFESPGPAGSRVGIDLQGPCTDPPASP